MLIWKFNIFVNAVKTRYENEEGTYQEIADTYTKLTDAEKKEILTKINA